MNSMNVSVRNPLGVIGLFATFIDGIACLVISVNFENLHGASERLPLIWFIIGFPVLILLAFVYLVVKYPQNLFGPGDYDNQELYLKAIGKNLRPNEEPKQLKKPENIPLRRNRTGICMMAISSSPKTSQFPYIKVQESALQRYADEHDMEIKTEVQIDKNLVCDGVAKKNGQLYLFEVKANYNSASAENAIRNLGRISEAMENKGCSDLHVVLILVSEDKLSSQTLENLRCKANDTIHNLDIVNYIREEIGKK